MKHKGKISVYRAELTEAIKPSIFISISTAVAFFLAIFLKEGFEIDQKMIEASILLGVTLLVICLLLIGACTYFYKITIFKDGLSSYNPWESFKCYFMGWESIENCRLRNIFGYKYYYLYSADQRECLWIPYNIKNKEKFYHDLLKVNKHNHIFVTNIKTT